MKLRVLILAGVLVCSACASQGRPVFVLPHWRLTSGAEFTADDNKCREVYFRARRGGADQDKAFSARVRCMQDLGYGYRGTN